MYRFTQADKIEVQPLVWASSSTFNAFCAMLHLGSAVFILIEDQLSNFINVSSVVPIKRLALDVTNQTHWNLVLVDAGSVSVFVLIATFMFITGSVHFFYAYWQVKWEETPGFWFRYAEYAISAPIMIVIIALLLGIREVYLLVLLAALTSITMVYGSIQDRVAIPLEEWKFSPLAFIMFPLWVLVALLAMFIVITVVEAAKSDLLHHYLVVHLRTPLYYTGVSVEQGGDVWEVHVTKIPGQADVVWALVALAVVTLGFRLWNIWADRVPWLIEFIVSGSLLTFLATTLAGLAEVNVVALMVTLVPTAASLIYIYRKLRDEGPSAQWPVSPHVLGFIPYVPIWAVIISYYVISVRDNDEKPPWFVNVIVFAELALFSCFALVQMYYVLLPSWRAGGTYEALDEEVATRMDGAYNILSLTSKLLLCWLAFGGIASQ
jgi:hypothetical protein